MAAIVPVHALINGGVILHYFRTSDAYRESGGLGAKVGIKKIKDSDLNGNEEIVPVKELIRSGAMTRIAVRYKNSLGYRRSGKILVNQLSMPGVFGDVAAGRLEGTDYKLESDLLPKGQIVGIGQIRRASYY